VIIQVIKLEYSQAT